MTPFEKRLEEYAKWWHYNKSRIPRDNLAKRCEFLEVAQDGCLELLALCALEMRQRAGKVSEKLWLPNGVKVGGDLTKFG